MSWFDEVTKSAPPPPAPKPQQQPGRANPTSIDWWGEVAAPGPSIRPATRKQAYTVAEDPSRMAGAGTQAIASLPTDNAARVRYYASKRFPGMPIEQAMDQYFYEGDRLAYRAPDGGAYYEEPRLGAGTGKAIAGAAGPAMAPVGATVAALPAMTTGPMTGTAAAIAGGGIAESGRQWLANKLTGEEKPFMDRAVQSSAAALQEGIGQLIGANVARVMQFMGRTPTFDIPVTSTLRDSAARFGIPLTAAEETGNRTLLRRQKILANTTEGEQRFTDFYQGRNDAVRTAVNDFLGRVSPIASPRMASAAGVEGAQAAIEAEQRYLSNIARPYYEAAEQGSVPMAQLTGGPAGERIAVALNAVNRAPVYRDTIGKAPPDSIPVVDAAKEWLDDKVKTTQQAGNTNEARLWRDAADELRTIADANVPAYGQARQVFEQNVPTRNMLERGIVGDVAKLEGPDTLRAGNVIFGKGSSPEDVRQAREAFSKANRMEDWDALVRSRLQMVFEDIPDSPTGAITNLGGTYRKALMGNQTKRNMMAAALEHNPGAWDDFGDLMKVLDATGRAMKGESITAFAQAGQKELEREAKGIGPRLFETIEVWRTPSRIANYWSDLQTGKYAARQAELLTTPEGREVLRELRQLGPTSKGAVVALSHFLTAGVANQAASALNQRPNGPAVSTPNMPVNQ